MYLPGKSNLQTKVPLSYIDLDKFLRRSLEDKEMVVIKELSRHIRSDKFVVRGIPRQVSFILFIWIRETAKTGAFLGAQIRILPFPDTGDGTSLHHSCL